MIERHITPLLTDSLHHFPAVLLTGARQVGKSTLVQMLSGSGWSASYLTLDDRTTLDSALTDPDSLIAGHKGSVIIDEIQRAPDLMRAIKLAIDRDRRPGRFLLTGSANVITLKNISETLAGRCAIHKLFPFSLAEYQKKRPSQIIRTLFESSTAEEAAASLEKLCSSTSKEKLLDLIVSGFYPEPCLTETPFVRLKWFESYRKTYIERDVREIQAVERLTDFGRMLTLAASRSGQIINYSDLARDTGLPYATLRRYINVLEQTYQIMFLPPYFINVSKRLIKTPKLYFTDTGMTCYLTNIHSATQLNDNYRFGAVVETWVASELTKMISLELEPMELYVWHVHGSYEIDFLVKKGSNFLAFECKSSENIGKGVLKTVEALEKDIGKHLKLCVILYGGSAIKLISENTIAVPIPIFFGGT